MAHRFALSGIAAALLFSARPTMAQVDDTSSVPAVEGDQPQQAMTPPPTPPPTRMMHHGGGGHGDLPVRAVPGNYGMGFRFGGLATMAANGNARPIAGGLVLTQVSLRMVPSDTWIIPLYFGTALQVDKPSGGSAAGSWGFDMGGGLEYHFRVWRRISPFIGAAVGLGVVDPTGAGNWNFGFGFGPQAGIEYYIADRVSLIAQYMMNVQFVVGDNNFQFAFYTMAGGAMSVVFYF